MRKLILVVIVFFLMLGIPTTISAIDKSTIPSEFYSTRPLNSCQNDEADRLVRESRNAYFDKVSERRNCPCPYDEMRDGRRCAGWSAYVLPGGEEPLCSRDDVELDDLKKACSAAGV